MKAIKNSAKESSQEINNGATEQENAMEYAQNLTEDMDESTATITELNGELGNRRQPSEAAKNALKKFQAESKAAKDFLRECLLGKHPEYEIPEEVLKAIRVLVPVRQKTEPAARGPRKQAVLDALAKMFPEIGSTITLIDIFRQFRMGEGEMRVRMRQAIHDRAPEERLWITYDREAEIYTLVAKGANAPEGWVGVLPKTNK